MARTFGNHDVMLLSPLSREHHIGGLAWKSSIERSWLGSAASSGVQVWSGGSGLFDARLGIAANIFTDTFLVVIYADHFQHLPVTRPEDFPDVKVGVRPIGWDERTGRWYQDGNDSGFRNHLVDVPKTEDWSVAVAKELLFSKAALLKVERTPSVAKALQALFEQAELAIVNNLKSPVVGLVEPARIKESCSNPVIHMYGRESNTQHAYDVVSEWAAKVIASFVAWYDSCEIFAEFEDGKVHMRTEWVLPGNLDLTIYVRGTEPEKIQLWTGRVPVGDPKPLAWANMEAGQDWQEQTKGVLRRGLESHMYVVDQPYEWLHNLLDAANK